MYSIGAGIGPNKVKLLKVERLSFNLYEAAFKNTPLYMLIYNIYKNYDSINALKYL